MKKNIFFLFLFMALISSTSSQNLVPNYSFEDTIHCPGHVDDYIGYVAVWSGVGGMGGLTYFNGNCNKYDNEGVPQNTWGYQNAHTGIAYAGIYNFVFSPFAPPDSNVRDFVEAPLVIPLVSGIKYYLTYYVSLSDSSKYACSNMDTYFSDTALSFYSYPVKEHIVPQVVNDPIENPLTDKVNWMKVTGTYVATGGEKYMTIGNFRPNYLSDTMNFPDIPVQTDHTWTEAYYYIDDVILSADSNYADSLMSVTQLKTKSEEVRVYPNPSNGIFTLTLTAHEYAPYIHAPSGEGATIVQVYNMLGKEIYSNPFNTQHSAFNIDLSGQPAGIYMYRVITQTGKLVGEGKLVIE